MIDAGEAHQPARRVADVRNGVRVVGHPELARARREEVGGAGARDRVVAREHRIGAHLRARAGRSRTARRAHRVARGVPVVARVEQPQLSARLNERGRLGDAVFPTAIGVDEHRGRARRRRGHRRRGADSRWSRAWSCCRPPTKRARAGRWSSSERTGVDRSADVRLAHQRRRRGVDERTGRAARERDGDALRPRRGVAHRVVERVLVPDADDRRRPGAAPLDHAGSFGNTSPMIVQWTRSVERMAGTLPATELVAYA